MTDVGTLRQLVELLESELDQRTGSRASRATDEALHAAIRDARRAALAFEDGQPDKARDILDHTPSRTVDTWTMVAMNFSDEAAEG